MKRSIRNNLEAAGYNRRYWNIVNITVKLIASFCSISTLVGLFNAEIGPISCGHLDANKTAGEEARRQLHKNVESNTE